MRRSIAYRLRKTGSGTTVERRRSPSTAIQRWT
jgi:hypothetical protein